MKSSLVVAVSGRRRIVVPKMFLLVSAIASSMRCRHPSSQLFRVAGPVLLADAFQPLTNNNIGTSISSFHTSVTSVTPRRASEGLIPRVFGTFSIGSTFQKCYSFASATTHHSMMVGTTDAHSDDESATAVTTTNSSGTESSSRRNNDNDVDDAVVVPLYRSEGLFAVHKPIHWTSQDVVSHVRGILEDEARDRGANPAKMTYRKRNKSRILKVGHGGTLDPLATGVLVIGVGSGTKRLNDYLTGSKMYRAVGQLGIETNTLDLDPKGNVTKEASWDHVTREQLEIQALPKFVGTIQQTPPIFSAKRQGGKKLYEAARQGLEVTVEPKEVHIHQLQLVSIDFPNFTIDMECGGGTFVRALIRDVAYELDTVATTAMIQRTKQGPFVLEDCLPQEDWNADNIYACIDEWNTKFAKAKEDDEQTSAPPVS
jgi:tRNA pseudouridine55 synthase